MMFLFLMLILFTGVISAGLRVAWGTAKFVFGLGLFFICPILFVLAVFLGMVSHLCLRFARSSWKTETSATTSARFIRRTVTALRTCRTADLKWQRK